MRLGSASVTQKQNDLKKCDSKSGGKIMLFCFCGIKGIVHYRFISLKQTASQAF
jgi:hypothetical protein